MSAIISDIMDETYFIDNFKIKMSNESKNENDEDKMIDNIFLKNEYIKMIREDILIDNIKNENIQLPPNPNKNSFKTYIKLVVNKFFKTEKNIINLYLNFVEQFIKINHDFPYILDCNIKDKLLSIKDGFIKTLYLNIVNYNIKYLLNNELYKTYNKKEYNLKKNINSLKNSINCNSTNKDFFKFIIIYILNNDDNIITNITNTINKIYNNEMNKIIEKIINKELYKNSKYYLNIKLYDNLLIKYCKNYNCLKTCDICYKETDEYFNRFCCNNSIICITCSVEHIKKSSNGLCPFCNDCNFKNDFNLIQNRLIKQLLEKK